MHVCAATPSHQRGGNVELETSAHTILHPSKRLTLAATLHLTNMSSAFRALLTAALSLSTAAPLSPPPGVTTSMAFVTNASWPYAHNSGWALLPSGQIAVVLQASKSAEGAASQVIFLALSADGGESFGAPQIIAGDGTAAVWGPVAAADGAVLRVFFAQAPADHPTALCGDLMTISSADDGRSWSAPQLLLPMSAWGGGVKCTDNKPARVSPTRWALPFFSSNAIHGQNGSQASGLLASAPGTGLAGPWTLLAGEIADPPNRGSGLYFAEPAVASCDAAAGEMLALLRNYELTWSARSSDGGASWSAPAPTELTNPYSKVDLAVWDQDSPGGPQSGALLLAHNPVANCTAPVYCARRPLGVSWTPDCGTTWSPPLLVEPVDGNRTFGYPTVAACGAGRICVSYTLDAVDVSLGIRFAAFDASLLQPLKSL
jgi:hypothetical protein